MAPIPEASMISCLKWAHFRLVIYCNSSILQHIIYISYISSTKKALHIIQSTSIHYFQSSSTIPWYPSYKMLGLKDPAFENRPSRPHSVCFSTVTVGCDGRQTTRKMSSDRKTTHSELRESGAGGDLWSWPKDQRYFPQNMGWFYRMVPPSYKLVYKPH
jgi:hypothetical protein